MLVTQPLHDAARSASKRFDKCIDLTMHVRKSGPAVHNEVGPRALFFIRQLAGKQMFEPLYRHAGSRQHAFALHVMRRAEHDRDVDALVRAGLEQQRDLEHGQPRALLLLLLEELDLTPDDHGMNDAFEFLETL